MNRPTSQVPKTMQSELKRRYAQKQTIFLYLKQNVATASMVTAANVPQKCICRYKRELEKSGLLWELVKKKCKATGFKAWYLTTDEKLVLQKTKQDSLSHSNSEEAANQW